MSSFDLLGGGAVGFLAARKVAERLPGPGYVSDQLHQAELRLCAPDILEIPASGIEIGGGIRIRRVMPEELGWQGPEVG